MYQTDRYFKKTLLAAAVLLSLSSGAVHAQSAVQQQKEIDELKKQLQELKALIVAQQPAVTTAAAPASDADQATIDAATTATKADIQGIRSDLENYKYDQARTGERNRASVTRNH